MHQKTIAYLHILSRQDGALYSQIPTAVRTDIDRLVSAQVLRKFPVGRGAKIYISDRDVLNEILTHHPLKSSDEVSHLPPRAQSAYLTGKTKSIRQPATSETLIFKALDGKPDLILRSDTNEFNITLLTNQFGVAGLEIMEFDHWEGDGSVVLVENKETFQYPHLVYGSENYQGLLLYTGNLSNLFLRWLRHKKRFGTVYLFPDYDPVGLSNIVRVIDTSESSSTAIRLVIPDTIDAIFEAHANHEIYAKNITLMKKIKSTYMHHPDIARIVELMELHGGGVEQEIISKFINK